MLQRTFPAGFIAPCLPTKTDKLPSGDLWLHEIKHDGFRVIARKDGDRVRLYSRPGNDMTRRFPLIAEALNWLKMKNPAAPAVKGKNGAKGNRDNVCRQEPHRSHAEAVKAARKERRLDGDWYLDCHRHHECEKGIIGGGVRLLIPLSPLRRRPGAVVAKSLKLAKGTKSINISSQEPLRR